MNSVVSEYCFGYNNNVIDDPIRAATMRANVSSILRGTKINANFGWIQGIIRRLPQSIARHLVPKGLIEIIRYKTVRIEKLKRTKLQYDLSQLFLLEAIY